MYIGIPHLLHCTDLFFLQIEGKTFHQEKDYNSLYCYIFYSSGLEPNLKHISEVCLYKTCSSWALDSLTSDLLPLNGPQLCTMHHYSLDQTWSYLHSSLTLIFNLPSNPYRLVFQNIFWTQPILITIGLLEYLNCILASTFSPLIFYSTQKPEVSFKNK